MSTEEITRQAEFRFLHDGEFHAKVVLAVSTIERERGVLLNASDRSLATLAAAVALLVPGPYVPGPPGDASVLREVSDTPQSLRASLVDKTPANKVVSAK